MDHFEKSRQLKKKGCLRLLVNSREMGNIRKRLGLWMNLLAGMICLGWMAWSFASFENMSWAFHEGSYYLIFLAFFVWVMTLVRYFQSLDISWNSVLKNYKGGLLFSAFMVALIIISVPPEFRIFNDEINLISMSLSMFCKQGVSLMLEATREEGIWQPFREIVPIRPFLFPFLLHLVHLVLGYQAGNAFVLNILILFSFFVMVYVLFKKKVGSYLAFSAILLIAAQPVFTLSATSGGFELLNIFFLFFVFAVLKIFLNRPSALSFQLVWISLILLAHTRPEAGIYFAVTIGMLIVLRRIKWSFFSPLYFYCLTFISLAPLVWQKLLLKEPYSYFEKPDDISIVSVDNFIRHSWAFLQRNFNFSFDYPYASLINIVGLLAIAFFGVHTIVRLILKRELWNARKDLTIIVILNVLTYWIVFNAYWTGVRWHYFIARYYAFPCVLLSLMPVLFVGKFARNRGTRILFLTASVAIFMFYHPQSIQNPAENLYQTKKQYDLTMKFFSEEYRGQNLLIVTNRAKRKNFPLPKQFIANNLDSITLGRFNGQSEFYIRLLQKGRYEEILIVETLRLRENKPLRPRYQKISTGIETKLLHQKQTNGTLLRISKVVPPQ